MHAVTWFVVADGCRGRVFAKRPRDSNITPALPVEFVASRQPTRERVSDRAGQTLERCGPGGHAKTKSQDAKTHGKELLARQLADAVKAGRSERKFDELVLVAPPAFLGQLRAALDGPSAKMISATYGKDLSKLTEHQLDARLRAFGPGSAPRNRVALVVKTDREDFAPRDSVKR